MTAKTLNINKKTETRGGRGLTKNPFENNRHSNRKCARAELEKKGKGYFSDFSLEEITEILEFSERPLVKLLRPFTVSADILSFDDCIRFFNKHLKLNSLEHSYELAESIAVFYFGKRRFSNYESFTRRRNYWTNKLKEERQARVNEGLTPR